MPFNATKKQLYVAVESTRRTPVALSSLVASGNANYIPIDASLEWDPDFQDRGISRTTLAKAPGTAGKKTGRLRFTLEMIPMGSTAATPIQFHHLLRACGCKYTALTRILCTGALTGTGSSNTVIRHGSVLTQGSVTAVVVGDHPLPATPATDAVALYAGRLEGLGVGTFATGTDIVITYKGAAAGTIASADFSAATANAATGYYPFSDPISTILFDSTGNTSTLTAGDVLKGTNSGALARVYKTITATANALTYVEVISGHFSTGEVIQNLTTADTDVGTLAAAAFEAQSSAPTLTLGLNEDGRVGSIAMAHGTVTFDFQGGRPVRANFEFQGTYNGIGDYPFVTASGGARTPVAFRSANLKVGPFNIDPTSTDWLDAATYAPCISRMQFNAGVELELLECANSSTGVNGYTISDRKPTLSMDPDAAPELASIGWITKMFADGLVRGSCNVGTTAPDLFTFGWTAGQPAAAPSGARGKVLTQEVNMNLTCGAQDADTGDNEWWLIWKIL